MNDPHVRALEYDFIPSENVDFKRAPPLRVETDVFSLTVDSGKAVFVLKQHFPSVEAARRPIDEYIGTWLMQAYLAGQESEFSLVYKNAAIVDRISTPPPPPTHGVVVVAGTGSLKITGYPATCIVSRSKFPDPPTHFVKTPAVETMYIRYRGYREGKEPLSSMAYMCLTLLEAEATASSSPKGNKRAKACKLFNIEKAVLDTIGVLSTNYGDPAEARKISGKGPRPPLTAQQRNWLEAALKAVISRVARVAHDPKLAAATLAMKDLPPL